MIRIVGTSHVSRESISRINAAFSERIPEIVAVELDDSRLYALQHNVKSTHSISNIRNVGVSGYVLLLFGSWIQRRLGRMTGTIPGEEMLHAVKLAKKHNSTIILIDRPIEVTLQHFSKEFSSKEKLRLLCDVIFPSRMSRLDVSRIPEDSIVSALSKIMRERYPGMYRSLVSERDEYMYGKIKHLADKDVLVVVGAAHVPGLKRRLARIEL
jgi:pheromone shutdown protein TraB